MRRLVVAVATLLALGIAAPASAGPLDVLFRSPAVPDVFNPPDGESRHVCVISEKHDVAMCIYIPMP